jgi:predicted DCC family thiol-disulfide oxidoreductase YuxK
MAHAPVKTPCTEPEQLTVLYDGDCPLCRREIAHVQRLVASHPNANLCFANIGRSVTNATLDTAEREALLARFHIQRADGTRINGAQAFIAMWSRLPGWKVLSFLARIPGVTPLLELAYRLFLKVRPGLQKLVNRFEKASGS